MKQIRTLIATAAIAIAGCFGANAQLLYKVEKQGSDKVSYILGTHHFAPVAVIDSISELPGIINSVDKLYGELDMSVMKDQATIMGMQQKMMATPDSTLDKVFTTAELDTIQSMLDRYLGGQITVAQLNLLKPATITTQAAAHMAMKIFPDQNPKESTTPCRSAHAKQANPLQVSRQWTSSSACSTTVRFQSRPRDFSAWPATRRKRKQKPLHSRRLT